MPDGIKKARVARQDLPAVTRMGDESFGYFIRYRIVTEDKNRFSPWSMVHRVEIPKPEAIEGGIGKNANMVQAVWQPKYRGGKYDVFTSFGFKVKYKELADGLATLTTINPHNFLVGDMVEISGTEEPFNGTFLIQAVETDKSFSFFLAAEDVVSHPTHGVARCYQYAETTLDNQYSFLANSNAENVRVSVQAESFPKERSEFLTIFQSIDLSLK